MKRILILMLILAIVAQPVLADTVVHDTQLKTAIKKALMDFFKNPGSPSVSVNGIKSMINVYLDSSRDTTGNIVLIGGNQTVYENANGLSGAISTCSDGTEYGECSTARKPKYCFGGKLIDRCNLCDCPSGNVCNAAKGTCRIAVTTTTLIVTTTTIPPACVDTDGGNEPYIKGRVYTAGGDAYDDSCANNNTVQEWACGTSGTLDMWQINCQYGCQDGACQNFTTTTTTIGNVTTTTTTTIPPACIDTDNGIDEYTYGKVFLDTRTYYDICEGDTVKEWGCGAFGAIYNKINCPIGCVDGVCKKVTGNTPSTGVVCSDSDGGRDYSTYGSVIHGNGNATDYDICMSNTILRENYCDNGYYAIEYYECPSSCSGGRCTGTTTTTIPTTTTTVNVTTTTIVTTTTTIPACIITAAGMIPNCAGNCDEGENIAINTTYTGDCSNTTYLQIDARSIDGACDIEYFGGSLSGLTVVDPYIGPSIVAGLWTIPAIPTECQGKTIYAWAAGLWNGPPSNGSLLYSIQDTAITDESPVAGSFTFATPPNITTTTTTVITTTTTTITIPAYSCDDSDGGFVLEELGTVYGYAASLGYNYTDYCNSTTRIVEYYCNGNISESSNVYCSWYNLTSCVNGICI